MGKTSNKKSKYPEGKNSYMDAFMSGDDQIKKQYDKILKMLVFLNGECARCNFCWNNSRNDYNPKDKGYPLNPMAVLPGGG